MAITWVAKELTCLGLSDGCTGSYRPTREYSQASAIRGESDWYLMRNGLDGETIFDVCQVCFPVAKRYGYKIIRYA